MAKSNPAVALTAVSGDAQTPSNDAAEIIAYGEPVVVRAILEGSSAFLFHRWSVESVAEKSAAAKNSWAKKTDDVESYVWRNEGGDLCIPGEYVRGSIIQAAKFRQDPRSPRKSAMDLFKAAIVPLTELASLGKPTWDYLDMRRVTVQRNAITRTRPAVLAGWRATFEFEILLPEYVTARDFLETLTLAGRVVGVGDFRPTYGRFNMVGFD
ncbi:MAG: hypothetical protein ABR532_05800 [Candidatus Dormibacteria bacterium]